MKIIKSYLLIYLSFIACTLPWVIYKAWNNRSIPGGINEALEGFTLYLLIAVPLSLGFAAIVYLGSAINKTSLGKKALIIMSALAGGLVFYLRLMYTDYAYIVELLIYIIIVALFLLFSKKATNSPSSEVR